MTLDRRETLLAAARVLDEKGWGTGNSAMRAENKQGLCILGAVAHAAGFHFSPPRKTDVFAACLIAANVIGSGDGVFEWNDDLPHSSDEERMRSRELVQEVLRLLAEDETLKFSEAVEMAESKEPVLV